MADAPDIQQPTPAGDVLGGIVSTTPTVARPAPTGFKQNFVSGLSGPQYTTDSSGNIINTKQEAPQTKGGVLGSVLAGAVMGALHGAAATKRGERGGVAFGSGVRADQEIRDAQAQRSKAQAQQSFQNKQSQEKMSQEEMETHARIAQMNATTAGLIQSQQYEAENHPLEIQAKKLGNEALTQSISTNRDEMLKNSLALSQNLAAMGIDPSMVIKSWEDAKKNARTLNDGQHVAIPNGLAAAHDDFGAGIYDRAAFGTPLTHDVTYTTYDKTDTNGNPVPTTHTLAADGKNTVSDYVAAAMMGQGQLLRQQSLLKDKVDNAQKAAQAKEQRARAALEQVQVDQFKNMGVAVPVGYTPPQISFTMPVNDLRNTLTTSGVQVPTDFENLYAIAHYKGDIHKDYSNRPYNRPGMPPQKSVAQAEQFIRTFINPKFDEARFPAVSAMIKDYADASSPRHAGGQLVAFNVGTGHLDQLNDAADALAKTDLPTLNKIANEIGAQTGKSARPVFNSIRGVLAGEIGKTVGSTTIPELEGIEKNLQSQNSPEAMQGVIKGYADVMLTKAGGLIQHYYDETGELPPENLDPSARAFYQKMGLDTGRAFPTGAVTPQGETNRQQPNNPQSPQGVPSDARSIIRDSQGTVTGYRSAGGQVVILNKPAPSGISSDLNPQVTIK